MPGRPIALLSLVLISLGPSADAFTNWKFKWRRAAEVGYRPEFLAARMDDDDNISDLKTGQEECDFDMIQHKFSIGHRGEGLQYPEHTKESYLAAAKQGARIIECDEQEPVCTIEEEPVGVFNGPAGGSPFGAGRLTRLTPRNLSGKANFRSERKDRISRSNT